MHRRHRLNNLSGKMIMLETVLESGANFCECSITESSEQGKRTSPPFCIIKRGGGSESNR